MQKFLFGALADKKRSAKIAYVAIFVALNIVVNAVTSIPLGIVQFSFTILVTSLTGILFGPFLGFAAGFLGDMLGFFIGGGAGNAYTPFVGLATALTAFLFGIVFYGLNFRCKGGWCIKVAIAAVLAFLLGTVAITTTTGYFLWNKSGLNYWDFLCLRLFVNGQVWNNVINTAALYAILPALAAIKPLKLQIL